MPLIPSAPALNNNTEIPAIPFSLLSKTPLLLVSFQIKLPRDNNGWSITKGFSATSWSSSSLPFLPFSAISSSFTVPSSVLSLLGLESISVGGVSVLSVLSSAALISA